MPMDLPRCTPEEVGISSCQAEKLFHALQHDKTTMNGFIAARHGKVFAEGWWAPYAPEMPHSNHSFGKSYTATAIGIAIGEGKVRLDEKMVDIFADYIADKNITPAEGVADITLEDVLTMTNGMAYHPALGGDFIANYFTTPVIHKPGTYFTYNTTGACMLGAVILWRTGMNLKEYLTPRLFEKIGIDPDSFEWRKFPNCIDAEPGTFATTESNLRLGMLYANYGKWNGEQVVPEEYIRSAMSIHTSTAHAPEPKDGLFGYGYQLWACSVPGAFRFDGGQGQYAVMWPEKDLVIALHEGGMGPIGPQTTLDTLYRELFYQLSDELLPADPEGYASLQKTCAQLKVADDEANASPIDTSLSGSYRFAEGRFDPWIAVAPPGVDDFFYLYRTAEKDVPITGMQLDVNENNCTITFKEGQSLTANWDGKLIRRFVNDSPFDPLGNYAATARMEDNKLVFHIHWLNGWFETVLTITKADAGIHVQTQKLRLNESDNWLYYQAEFTKE